MQHVFVSTEFEKMGLCCESRKTYKSISYQNGLAYAGFSCQTRHVYF